MVHDLLRPSGKAEKGHVEIGQRDALHGMNEYNEIRILVHE